MQIIKRDGTKETVKLEKISKRIERQSKDLKNVDYISVAQKVVQGLYDGVSSRELDKLAAETAYSMSVRHPDYDKLATRIAITALRKETDSTFSAVIEKLTKVKDANGVKKQIISDSLLKFVKKHSQVLDSTIDYERDFNFDFFGFKTLERSYLLKVDGQIVERPQHMWMRVACGIHSDDIDAALNTYHMLSTMQATHATPTLFNAGLVKNQLSSCFLIGMKEDSISGIYDTLKECALISQSAGGIGLHIHNIRSKGSPIYGTNGSSNGIIPMLKNFNETARYVDQCFAGDTIVYTKEGPKEISNVAVGDELISDKGEFNRVAKVIRSNHSGKMISLKVKHSVENVLVKEEHPFLVIKNQKKGSNFSVIKNRLDKGLISPEWIEARDLTSDDLIAFPITNFEKDMEEYSESDCRMYGLLLGDGWIAKDNSEVRLYLNKGDDLPFVRQYLNDLLIPFVEELKDKESDGEEACILFRWSMKSNFKFDRNMLYSGDEKRIHHSMINLPKNKSLQIIKGLVESDGHVGSLFNGAEKGSTEIVLEMSSEPVINSARYILMRFGILTSGYRRNRIGNVSKYKQITTKKETICLRLPKVKDITDLFGLNPGSWVNQFPYNNYVFSRVSKKSIVDFNGVVYDFEVLPDHNYLTEIGIAHNGGGKRKGSIAVYLEPWHADIFSFLDLRKNNGKEELRARDLNLALWCPDLFFKAVESNGDWYLMDPNISKGLADVYDEKDEGAFSQLYNKYVAEEKFVEKIKARDLFTKILDAQIEGGQPYILAKDAGNKKSNQKNIGTISSSNLCCEIFEVSSPEETAVCNLASISLTACVEGKKGKRTFNFKKLEGVVKTLVENLNKIIDIEYYPVETAKKSNLRHRPIGIGIQGLADVFALLRFAWDSEEALSLNRDIAETIYYSAVKTSMELAKKSGAYDTFVGSPASQGLLQFDLWEVQPSDRYDWGSLKKEVVENGLRNSLLVAPMPTASTSQILGNVECFEPITSNIYKRATLSGEFIQVNKYLVEDLMELGLWSEELRQKIIYENGSVQNIPEIPDNIKALYKTVWEISQRVVIDMAAARGPFVCQSQSMNLYFKDATFAKISSALMYAWKKGLKTLVYYTRTQAAREAIKFTVDMEKIKQTEQKQEVKDDAQEALFCSLDNPENCEMCSG